VAAPQWSAVAPIIAEHCVGCHQPGGVAPFSLTSAQQAHDYSSSILAAVQQGVMPPWPPGADSPAFVGQERRILTAVEKATLVRWLAAGAPIGTGGPTGPAPPSESTAPGRTLSLQPATAYTPHTSSGASDDYHCYLLEPNLDRDVFVTSALIRPQRTSIVHHVILFEAAAGTEADQARALDARSGGRGWTCFGGPGIQGSVDLNDPASFDRLGQPQWVAAWVPGHVTNDLPAGTGVLLHAGAAIVMQVHYNLLHGTGADRPSAVLRVVDAAGSGLTPLDTVLVPAPVELPCPRGDHAKLCSRSAALADEVRKYGADAAYVPQGLLILCNRTLASYPQHPKSVKSLTTSCTRPVRRPETIYGVAGHMHLRGVDIKVELDPGTPQARTLLHIPRWNFHWQDAYYLVHPVDAGPGDTIRVSCRYDNSRANQPVVGKKQLAPRYILWGEGTTDEMCLGLLQVVAR
jgi:hypothetical protein